MFFRNGRCAQRQAARNRRPLIAAGSTAAMHREDSGHRGRGSDQMFE